MTLTKKEIDKLAGENGLKIPSYFTTNAKREEWLLAAIDDKRRGFSPISTPHNMKFSELQPVTVPRYTIDNVRGWLEHLHRFGYTAIQDVLPFNVYNQVVDDFWTYLGSCNPKDPILRDVPESWSYDKVIPNSNGVFKTFIGYEKFIWDVRINTVRPFQNIWGLYGKRDLVSSFDGGSLLIPTDKDKFKTWLHFDQPRKYRDFCCVQGVMTLSDSFEDDGGFCFSYPDSGPYRGMERFFNYYMDNHKSCGLMWGKIDMTDPVVKSLTIKKLCVPKNTLILFDSRLLHANVPSRRNTRLAVYTSFQPRSGVTKEIHEKRIKAVENQQMTGHWCYGEFFGVLPKLPNAYGKEVKYPHKSFIPKPTIYENII